MKKTLYKIAAWLWKQLFRFYTFLKIIVIDSPKRISGLIFRMADWGKIKLDQRINHEQRERLHTIIFKTETREGHLFDTILTWIIILSIVVVMLETVSEVQKIYWWFFFLLEWGFTLVFTVEYILRLYCARKPLKYATSFFGIVDLLSIIPAYIGIFFLIAQNLIIVRALRLLRIFRIFKMGHFVKEGEVIMSALNASKTKIYVFISFVVLMALIIGSLMYIVEGHINPNLNNIPKGVYWAVVTLTTVGYGDITPITALGKFLATLVMIMGYGVIAVPTGIVTAEISGRVMNLKEIIFQKCPTCEQAEHHTNSTYCHNCATKLVN